CQHSYRIPFTF
nr:immunoglobulin light chain junction region [Macaca mulatta]